MKKSFFLLGLLTTAVCLSACGSKDFNMSFEEALEIANHSELQEVLAWNDNFEQAFIIAGNYAAEWTSVDANVSSTSKQSLVNKNSESSTQFNANITSSWETIKANWALDIKFVDDTLYLNLSSLDLTWSEDLSFVAMMTAGFKDQWFSIPMSGLSEVPNTFSVLKDSKELNTKTKEIVINEWSTVYNWKFTQFNWYNAWKFSLDNEKLNALIKEYYDWINSSLESEEMPEIPELNIQDFEWYLVITWKDKVTTVIENMKIEDNETAMDVNWFGWEDLELYLSEDNEEVISIKANKKWGKYEVSVKVADIISLDGTVSPKLSKSSIDLKFDAKLTIKGEEEWGKDTVIPFNGSWKYNWISEFNTNAPEGAQDLSELLWSYLGMMWWEDYEDLYWDEFDELEDVDTENPEEITDVEAPEVEESAEATETAE